MVARDFDPYGSRAVSPRYRNSAPGTKGNSARSTVRPPKPESNTPIFRRPLVTDASLQEHRKLDTPASGQRGRRGYRAVAHPPGNEPERPGESWRAECL